MGAWFFMLGPLILGMIGLMMLLNIFGATDDLTDFYNGRGDWFPILSGDEAASHRLVGAILLAAGVVTTIAFVKMGVL